MAYTDHFDEYIYRERPHSGPGIASFIIAIAMGLFLFVLLVIAGILEESTPNGIDENSPVTMLLGAALIGASFLDFLGVILGIAGLCQPNRNKLFAVLGLLFGSLVLFGVVILMIVGMLTS